MGSIQRGLELVSVATQLWLIIEDLVKIFLKLKNDDGVRKQKFRYIIEQYFGEQKCELWQVEDNESQIILFRPRRQIPTGFLRLEIFRLFRTIHLVDLANRYL